MEKNWEEHVSFRKLIFTTSLISPWHETTLHRVQANVTIHPDSAGYFGPNRRKKRGLGCRGSAQKKNVVPPLATGIGSEELFYGNSQEFPQILSTFSPGFLKNWWQEIPWNWLQEISWIELWESPQNGLQEIFRTWLREIPRNSCRLFHLIFLWKFLGNFRGFPRKIPRNFSWFSAKLLLGMFMRG